MSLNRAEKDFQAKIAAQIILANREMLTQVNKNHKEIIEDCATALQETSRLLTDLTQVVLKLERRTFIGWLKRKFHA